MQYFGLEKKMEAREMIAIRGLTKTFGTGSDAVTALRDIDLSVRAGEIFGIIGLSGAGKSTLVRCMNYLEHPTEGSVTVDGKKLGALNKKELLNARRGIGMIFQQFNLLMQKTALDNICFPLEIAGVSRKDAIDRARELLKLVDLEDREKAYPAQLSGGQKQRVAIARALAPSPKVLLCDEATSALDPTTTRSILSLAQGDKPHPGHNHSGNNPRDERYRGDMRQGGHNRPQPDSRGGRGIRHIHEPKDGDSEKAAVRQRPPGRGGAGRKVPAHHIRRNPDLQPRSYATWCWSVAPR